MQKKFIVFSFVFLGIFVYLFSPEIKKVLADAGHDAGVVLDTNKSPSKIELYTLKQENSTEELNNISFKAKVRDDKYIEFPAGKDGVVRNVYVNVGDKVSAGDPLLTIYHPQSQEAAASLAIEAKKAEIDAQIIKDASVNLKNFNEKYNDKLKTTIQTSQNSINNSVDNFVSNSLNSSTSTSSYTFNINKTLEQDIREIQEKISQNKNAGSKIDSNMLAKGGISGLDSAYFYEYANILANTKYDGNVIEAYTNASQFYSATLKLLNVSVSGTNGLSQAELNSLKDKIVDRISDMASNYQDINSVILDSIKTKYEAEVAKANTNLDLQKTLLSAEKEIEQNNLEVKKLEAQANLYPEIYKTGLGNILYTTYTAPFDGVVNESKAVNGTFVKADEVVISLQGSKGKITAISEIDPGIRLEKNSEIVAYDAEKPYQIFKANIQGISTSLNKKNLRNIFISLEQGTWYSNQNIRIRMSKNANLDIPLSAVMTFEDKTYVWKVVDGLLSKTEVVLGAIIDTRIVIEKGLDEGDVIASRDVKNLLEGMNVYENEDNNKK